jgi:hypothetical protein
VEGRALARTKKENQRWFSFLCPIVTNYRTFIDDMYKVLEFAEWVKEMGDFALLA